MTAQTKAAPTAAEFAAIGELISDLEKRLHHLSDAAKREYSGASSEVNDFINDALSRIMDRVRDDKAADLSSDTLKTITDKEEERPLAMLANAAGIDFLFAIARR
jgi:ElaB/YqjD/DUF883 family membrane-anchored ribosome-binding protein